MHAHTGVINIFIIKGGGPYVGSTIRSEHLREITLVSCCGCCPMLTCRSVCALRMVHYKGILLDTPCVAALV